MWRKDGSRPDVREATVEPALTPAPALVARFRSDLEALTGEAPTPESRLGVAVSGGGDSLALLLLATAAYPGAVVAATVDHRLRPEAAAEAAMVRDFCVRLDVEHDLLRIPDDVILDGNVPDQARRWRYVLLADWAHDRAQAWRPPGRARWIATGHQQDDVAETFLMRARRGAGVGGLAAMVARRPIVEPGDGSPDAEIPVLIRPLLGWSRATLASLVREAGLRAIADPSNSDPRYDRARLRTLLRASPELSASRLALAARNLRDAEDALVWTTNREKEARWSNEDGHGTVMLDMTNLPHELRRRLVSRMLDYFRTEFDLTTTWRGAAVDRFIRLLEAGRPATLAGVLARPGPRWHFTLAPPRRTS